MLVLGANIQLVNLRLKAFPVSSMKYVIMNLLTTNISWSKSKMSAITPKIKQKKATNHYWTFD